MEVFALSLSYSWDIMRVATWNLKQAVAPKRPLDILWDYIENEIDPDVIVLTEARPPRDDRSDRWNLVYRKGGIGERRTWGTIVASRKGVDIAKATFPFNHHEDPEWHSPAPGTVETVDVMIDRKRWATIVGAYGFMPKSKDGFDALPGILCEVLDALNSGRERLILAGDFNLWPEHLNELILQLPFVDVIGSISDLPPLERAVGGSRIWTHKNGNSENAARQELDFIYVSEDLADELVSGGGGIDLFPDAWEFSDHAPVVADFEV